MGPTALPKDRAASCCSCTGVFQYDHAEYYKILTLKVQVRTIGFDRKISTLICEVLKFTDSDNLMTVAGSCSLRKVSAVQRSNLL